VIILYPWDPSEVRKLAEAQGLSYEETLNELNAGILTLPERLPLSPEEEQQSFEDLLIEAMSRPVSPDYFGQTL
jgi:hypothetical protein